MTFGNRNDGLHIHHHTVDVSTVDVVIPRIGASTMSYAVPLLHQFELLGTPVVNSSDAFLLSRDKLMAGQMLAAMDLPVPATLSVRAPEEIDLAVERLGGPPLVVKIHPGTQGVGVAICETVRSIRSTVEAFWSVGREVLLQEFIAEAAGSDIRMFVVNGEVVATMRRTAKSEEFRSNLHRGGTAESVDPGKELSDIAIRAADSMDLLVAGVDVLESNRGPLVMEVNPSPGLQGIEDVTRVDVATAIIRCAESLV